MQLSDYIFEVPPGSLELNLPPAYVTRKPALYRDFLQFGRVALELLPQDLITADLLAAYPPLVPPARDDLDAAGDPMYQFIDRDPSKGFTNASELEWFENNKVFKKTKADLFWAQGIVITYLDSRLSAAAQEALHAKTDFGLLRSANNLVKIFELIDSMLMFGPKKSSIGAARNFLLGTQTGSLPAFVNRIDADATLFLHTFGFAGQPQPTDHSYGINHDKLKKAVLFMNTTDPDLERYIERFQESYPDGTFRQASQHLMNVVQERVVPSSSSGRGGKVSFGPSTFTAKSLVADVSEDEEVPMCYLSGSGGPPPPRSVKSS